MVTACVSVVSTTPRQGAAGRRRPRNAKADPPPVPPHALAVGEARRSPAAVPVGVPRCGNGAAATFRRIEQRHPRVAKSARLAAPECDAHGCESTTVSAGTPSSCGHRPDRRPRISARKTQNSSQRPPADNTQAHADVEAVELFPVGSAGCHLPKSATNPAANSRLGDLSPGTVLTVGVAAGVLLTGGLRASCTCARRAARCREGTGARCAPGPRGVGFGVRRSPWVGERSTSARPTDLPPMDAVLSG